VKNQYFGDVGDYFKYALLRRAEATGLRLGVIWMLTDNDGSADGGRREYLARPDAYRRLDPTLYEAMQRWDADGIRDVGALERSGLLSATFFSEPVSDDAAARAATLHRAVERMAGADVVFLDPDNGLQIRSCRYGARRSSKFVYWSELRALWARGHSIVVYQHLPRVSRPVYLAMRAEEFAEALGVGQLLVINSVGNLFFGAVQPRHRGAFDQLTLEVARAREPRLSAELVALGPDLREF
jgi:hypothetical protein